MKKNIWILVLKTLAYAITLALGFLGVSSLASCTMQRNVSSAGKAIIITVDTTVIRHDGYINFKK